MPICNSCGADFSATTRFCVKCGAPRDGVTPRPESWREPSGELNQRSPSGAPQQQPPTVPFTPPERQQTGQQAQRPTTPYPQPPGTYMPPPYTPPPAAPPVPVSPFAIGNQTPHGPNKTGQLPQTSMTLGIITACFMLIGMIPCLGWLNWFTLTLAFPAIIISIVAAATEQRPDARNKAIIGLILASVAMFLGGFRLILGAGCL